VGADVDQAEGGFGRIEAWLGECGGREMEEV
jgi:hypothetical protein